MRAEQIYQLIAEPKSLIYEKHLPMLRDALSDYPFFAPTYVLIAKLLYEEKSIYFEKYLKLASLYVGDREVLYNYIHGLIPTAFAPEQEVATISPKQGDNESDTIPQNNDTINSISEIDQLLEAEINDINIDSNPLTYTENEILAFQPTDKEPISNEEAIPDTENKSESVDEDSDLISLIEIEEKEITSLPNQFESLQTPSIIHETVEDIPLIDEKNIEDTNQQNEKDLVSIQQQPLTYLEWLQAKKQTEIVIIQSTYKGNKKQNADELIEKFIKEEPKISRIKPIKMYNPINKAVESNIENPDIVSETLADIYIKQELFDLASILLVLIILAQSPKGGGGLSNIGSGASQYLGARQTADVLEKATWYFGLGILAIVIVSFFFTTGSNNEGEIRRSKTEGTDYAPGFLQNSPQTAPQGTEQQQQGDQPQDVQIEIPEE